MSATTGRPLPLAFDFDLSDARLAVLGIRSVKRLAILAPFGIDVAPGEPLLVRHADEGRRLELLSEPTAEGVAEVPELPQLPVEIEPLTRPTGLWTGNIFTGIVRKDGQPLPNAEIEVEYLNDGSVSAPNPAFVTQVLKADAEGKFSYAMPRAGWWGFAALTEGDEKMKAPDGSPAPVEVGGLIWVKATDMK